MPAHRLAEMLLAELMPTCDPIRLAEHFYGPAMWVPASAVAGAAALVVSNDRRLLLLSCGATPQAVDVACAFFAARAWLIAHDVPCEAAHVGAKHVGRALRVMRRTCCPRSGVLRVQSVG